MDNLPWLIAAGFLAGAMNAIAGGGSFVTFPVLVLAGLPAVIANATSTVALFPGTIASTWAYRDALRGIAGVRLRVMLPISVVGGLVGAGLLLVAPASAFDAIIPWLLLLATMTFAGGREFGLALSRRVRIGMMPLLLIQFAISVYGGYFGGAVGLMMLAVWSLLDAAELKSMAGARTLLVSAANGAAVLCFISAGAVAWPEALSMLVAAAIGGYAGARAAGRVPARVIRLLVLLISTTVTAAFFARAYG